MDNKAPNVEIILHAITATTKTSLPKVPILCRLNAAFFRLIWKRLAVQGDAAII
jgi:hypothetical protein